MRVVRRDFNLRQTWLSTLEARAENLPTIYFRVTVSEEWQGQKWRRIDLDGFKIDRD